MALGNQTAQVIKRVKGKHADYAAQPLGDPVQGCSLQPLGSAEQLAGGELITSRWRFYAPPDFPTDSRNLIDISGLRLHVDGDLQVVTDKRGRPDHVFGLLKKWEG